MSSENGWNPSWAGPELLEWIKVPGTNPPVSLQMLNGRSLWIMRAYAADYNANIEPLRDDDSACYTPTNKVATSNHLNGTAMDLNWNDHAFQVDYAGYDPAKIQRMREMLAFYNFEGIQIMFWAQDWDSPKDAMHHQMGYDTYQNPDVLDRFIRERIRPDGFSTYKRGSVVVPPPSPPVEDGAVVLSKVMGGSVSLDRYRELLPAYRLAVTAANAATPKRINMFTAQLGHESGGLKYMEEIADGSAYEGRPDLGNTEPGDGKRYKGRGPIQITGRHNYTELSKWAFSKGFVPSPTFFVDQPVQLASPQFGFLGAVWYWTVARPRINEYCDWDDLEASLVAVTKAINGGLNGLADRRNRLNLARSMDLAPIMRGSVIPSPPLPEEDDFMPELSPAEQRALFNEIMSQRYSHSPLRHLGEGTIGRTADIVGYMDGSIHIMVVKVLAALGSPEDLALLHEIAGDQNTPEKYPDRQKDKLLAQAILADITSMPEVPEVARQIALPTFAEPTYLPAVEQVSNGSEPKGLGDVVKTVVDAVQQLKLADALSNEDYATLDASIKILQMKNGSDAR